MKHKRAKMNYVPTNNDSIITNLTLGIIVNTAHEGGKENESEKSVLIPSITANLKLYKT